MEMPTKAAGPALDKTEPVSLTTLYKENKYDRHPPEEMFTDIS